MKNDKKVKLIIGLIVGFMVLGLLTIGGAGYYYFQIHQKKFVGTWAMKSSRYFEQKIEVDEKNNVTFIMESDVAGLTSTQTSITYEDTYIKGKRLFIKSDSISRYLISFKMEEDSLIAGDTPELAREFIKSGLTSLTDDEIDKYFSVDGTEIRLDIDDSQVIKKMMKETVDLYLDEEKDSEEKESTEIIFILSEDKNKIKVKNYGSNEDIYVRQKETKKTKATTDSSKKKKETTLETEESSEEPEIVEYIEPEIEEEEEWIYDLDKFAYYFLILEDEEKRKDFIEEFVAEEAKEMFEKHLKDEPVYPNAVLEDIYSDERIAVDEDKDVYLQLVSVKEEVNYILKKDEKGKILDVYGEGWTSTTKEKMKELETYIRVRPTLTLKYFVVYYLIETDKAERKVTINENPEYATEAARALLLAHADDDFADFKAGSWYPTEFKDGSFGMIINDSDDNSVYIMKLNEESQLTNVYGGSFEALSDEEWNYAMDNKDDLVTIF